MKTINELEANEQATLDELLDFSSLYYSKRTQEIKSKAGWRYDAIELYSGLYRDDGRVHRGHLPKDWFERISKVWKLILVEDGFNRDNLGVDYE